MVKQVIIVFIEYLLLFVLYGKKAGEEILKKTSPKEEVGSVKRTIVGANHNT